MRQYIVIILWLALLVACSTETEDTTNETPGTDTTETVEDTFDSETQLGTTADIDMSSFSSYWPFGWFYAAVVALEPPAPPYEIRELGVMVMNIETNFSHNGGSYKCSGAAQLELLVWVESELEPNAYLLLEENGAPHLPAVASAIVSGVGAETGTVAELLTATLEEPVTINTAGTLYVAARRLEPEGDIAPCLFAGPSKVTEPTWVHTTNNNIPAWSTEVDSRPDFRVTVGYQSP